MVDRDAAYGQEAGRHPDDRYADTQAARFAHKVDRIAVALASLSEDVKRRREPRNDIHTGRPNFTGAAHDVIHDVMWALANLHVDDLVVIAHEATDADRGRPAPTGPSHQG